jgi:hypothetical protein
MIVINVILSVKPYTKYQEIQMALTLNKSNWLIRWACWFSDSFDYEVDYNKVDSCSFINALIKAFLWTIIFVAIISLAVAVTILAPIYAAFVWLFTYTDSFANFINIWMEAHQFVLFGIGVDLIFVFILVIFTLSYYFLIWLKNRPQSGQGTISTLYDSWKNKYCLPINIIR